MSLPPDAEGANGEARNVKVPTAGASGARGRITHPLPALWATLPLKGEGSVCSDFMRDLLDRHPFVLQAGRAETSHSVSLEQ